MKQCMKCNQTKNYSDFRPTGKNKSGYSSYCIPCMKEYNREYHKKQYTLKYAKDKIVGDTKICSQCSQYKPFSDFKTTKHSWCNECQKEYDRKRNEKYLARPRKRLGDLINCSSCNEYLPESSFETTYTYCVPCKKQNLLKRTIKKHGITTEQYEQMYQEQNGKCKICYKEETTAKTRLSIDHDHSCCPGEKSCGKCVRGLLCHHCNTALGHVKDNPKILQKMIEYLR